jgi:CheY-like chemotaxis protein
MRRVLVVDDAAEMRALARAYLRRMPSVEVIEADGGAAALRWAATVPIALVLTDLQMPAVDGFALIDRLRADPATRAIPIVAMSADATILKRASALGADATIAKPFRAEVLIGLLLQLLPPA